MEERRIKRFNRRLDQHTEARLRSEDALARRFYGVLEGARREMLARVIDFEDRWNGERTYTSSHLAATILDLKRVLDSVASVARIDLRDTMLEGFGLGQEQTFIEIAEMRPGFMTGVFQPRVPTQAMLAVLEGKTEVMDTMFAKLGTRIFDRLRVESAIAADDREAAIRTLASVRNVQDQLAKGFASGEGTLDIARRLFGEQAGEMQRLTYREAIITTRLAVNDAYNDGHVTTLRDAQASDPEMRQAWLSALVGSTPICLRLHGQRRNVGENFVCGGWQGKRPPAIGEGAEPKFHLCRSRVVPDHPDWPENPRLNPLSEADIRRFERGGGLRAIDVGPRRTGPRLAPSASRS